MTTLFQGKKEFNKKLDNKSVPKYVSNHSKWCERDGLMTWYDWAKCQEFLEDTDSHFQNLEIANFDIINSNGKLPQSKTKQYQTVNHSEILTYSLKIQDKIFSVVFRTKRGDVFVEKKTVKEHF